MCDRTLVIELELPPQQLALFQGLLQGEEGLALIRCFDPAKLRQQLWTAPSQRTNVFEWLRSLPAHLRWQVVGEWVRDERAEAATQQKRRQL